MNRLFKTTISLSLLMVSSYSSNKLAAQQIGNMALDTGTPPAGFSDAKSFTPNALGVGNLSAPDGWQEIRWCQIGGATQQRGLIVTRENCSPNVIGLSDKTLNDFIFKDPLIGPGPGSGETGSTSYVPVPVTLGSIPFLPFYSPLSSPTPSPLLSLRAGQQPMFQVRTVDYPGQFDPKGSVKSRFIVMPDGNCGINNEDPRAAIDVLDANAANVPVAIFGNVLPPTAVNLPRKTVTVKINNNGSSSSVPVNIEQTYSRHIAIVPRLRSKGYNSISQDEDMGLFFTNGLGLDGSHTAGALVIGPYSKDPDAGGIRIEANGSTEIRGLFVALS
jgi:hypothetical protein